jgi:hypothetical protein
MAYIHPQKPDILVAFCHLDDQPVQSGSPGWVTTLIGQLTKLVALKMGSAEPLRVVKDHAIVGGHATEEEIGLLRDAAVVVVVLSPGLLVQAGLGRLLGLLAEKKTSRTAAMGVVVVETDRVNRPQELADVLACRFWSEDDVGRVRPLGYPAPGPRDKDYYARLFDLGTSIAVDLKRLAAATRAQPVVEPSALGADRKTVYLAQATDDLDARREDVRRFLVQYGFRVLPSLWRDDAESFREAARADLQQSGLFIQLLSTYPGKRVPGSDKGLVGLQYETAVALGVPILQWLSGDIDPKSVEQDDHRALLAGSTVMVSGLQEFLDVVMRRLASQTSQESVPPPLSETGYEFLVFVNPERLGLDLEARIQDLLQRRGIGVLHPSRSDDVAKTRECTMANLTYSDGLVLVPAGSSVTWCNHQIMLARKASARRERPMGAIAVALDHEVQSDEAIYNLPNLMVIDCREGVNEPAFQTFIEALRVGGSS